jgi:hypothetical protein
MATGYQIFLLLNNFRALNTITKAPVLYPGIESDTLLNLNLCIHDSYFILPIIVAISNYLALRSMSHPWLINYNLHSPRKLILLSFTFSLFSVFWPKCYCISWISYCLMNFAINNIANFYSRKTKAKLNYKNYVENNYKSKLEKAFKIKI